MSEASPTILLVKYRALGDSVMGLSTLSYLRSIYPNSKIYYAVRDWTASLYKNVETDADEIIPVSLNTFSDHFRFWKKISSLKVDHIHEMHASGRTKRFFSLYYMLSNARYTFHDHHLSSGGVVRDQGVKKALIQRDLDGAYSYFGKDGDIPSYLNFVPNFKGLTSEEDNSIIFGVVATRDTKMWSFENYVKLANLIKDEFPDTQIKVPLSTSEQDKKILDILSKLDERNILTFIHEPLEGLPNFVSKSKLYIGNDTGLKHLAIACGLKTFTFFGPEPPREWHPYDKEKHPYFFIDNLECRTREAHYCGLSQCDSMICLKDITVQSVFEQIKKELQ